MVTVGTYIRYVLATCVCVLAICVIFYGISNGYNLGNFGGPFVEIPLLVAISILLAYNEGFQVGCLRVEHLDSTTIEADGFPRAARIHRLIFGPTPRYMVYLHTPYTITHPTTVIHPMHHYNTNNTVLSGC